jgi:lysophospholipid acyltransferase (LPLAT)-like uncharacterized protein
MIRARVLSFLAWMIVSLWSRSLRVRYVSSEVRDRLRADGKNFIYAFWHGSMFLLLRENRNSGVVIPVSESSDGDIMALLLKRFGFDTVRGSSSRNGHKALLGMVCGLRKGETIGVAVDGPRGPLHEVKKGTAFLAARLNVPVIPVAVAARRSWVLESTWEKLMLPKPFTDGVVMFGEPVQVKGLSEEAIEAGRQRIEQALRTLTEEAREQAAAGSREPLFGAWIGAAVRKPTTN